ncbi:MAG TPA: lytic murein transglycosylase [Solirubrobacteraceae bacterium]|nr:lytic murein transglycosylase [Solirubrobacteraceae bacterium]
MRRKLWIWLIALGASIAALAAIPLSVAQAETCTVTVTLITGQKQTFTVNVAPGTPISQIPLPVTGTIVSETESCPSTTTTTPVGTTTTKSGTGTTTSSSPSPSHNPSGSGNSSGSGSGSKPKPKGSGNRSSGGSRTGSGGASPSAPKSGRGTGKKAGKPSAAQPKATGPGGVPTAVNPTFSFALPGPAPLGVPNFFIDSFQIPPFLLPIYQAAGIEYNVPWQVLAAINWIETDYGRNLSVSSAGAVGWMQFLPSTWKEWGVDATGSGYADPYNPTDAIFTAARYLQAAGASKNLAKAIFAYNHASWYVQSVLLRAQLIGGMPSGLVGALTSLVEGHFPVAAKAKYADSSVLRLAHQRIRSGNAAEVINSDPTATGTAIYAAQNSPVIAVNDGKIIRIGQSAKLGRFVVLQDETGNTFTYAHLGSIPHYYPVPKPEKITAADIARELSIAPARTANGSRVGGLRPLPAPTSPATAGKQLSQPASSTALSNAGVRHSSQVRSHSSSGAQGAPISFALAKPSKTPSHGTTSHKKAATTPSTPMVKERLFANPSRPASYAAGGKQQIANSFQISSFRNYFADVLHLGKNQYTLAPLRKGAVVVAGTILGRIGAGTRTSASHMYFMIQPAGRNAPYIDPKPILDGWKLLEATAVYRAAGVDPFFGSGARSATIGEILLETKTQLEARVLADPHVKIYTCGRRDIQAGLIDRRILGAIEFLSASGLDPTISGLACDAGSHGIDAAGKNGSSMDISAINGIPIQGNQGPGSITDLAIRRLLTLQGAMAPDQIISLHSYRGEPTTLGLPDHANRIQVTYTPAFGANQRLSGQVRSILKPKQWVQLIQHISQIPEPAVPTGRSRYAVKASSGG